MGKSASEWESAPSGARGRPSPSQRAWGCWGGGRGSGAPRGVLHPDPPASGVLRAAEVGMLGEEEGGETPGLLPISHPGPDSAALLPPAAPLPPRNAGSRCPDNMGQTPACPEPSGPARGAAERRCPGWGWDCFIPKVRGERQPQGLGLRLLLPFREAKGPLGRDRMCLDQQGPSTLHRSPRAREGKNTEPFQKSQRALGSDWT